MNVGVIHAFVGVKAKSKFQFGHKTEQPEITHVKLRWDCYTDGPFSHATPKALDTDGLFSRQLPCARAHRPARTSHTFDHVSYLSHKMRVRDGERLIDKESDPTCPSFPTDPVTVITAHLLAANQEI